MTTKCSIEHIYYYIFNNEIFTSRFTKANLKKFI